MQSLEIDKERNLVRITLAGRFDAAQADALYDAAYAAVTLLEKGFCVFSDLTELQEFEPEARGKIREMMQLFNRSGVGNVVRVSANPLHDFGFTIMSHFHYDCHVPVTTFGSHAEAAPHLPPPQPRVAEDYS